MTVSSVAFKQMHLIKLRPLEHFPAFSQTQPSVYFIESLSFAHLVLTALENSSLTLKHELFTPQIKPLQKSVKKKAAVERNLEGMPFTFCHQPCAGNDRHVRWSNVTNIFIPACIILLVKKNLQVSSSKMDGVKLRDVLEENMSKKILSLELRLIFQQDNKSNSETWPSQSPDLHKILNL